MKSIRSRRAISPVIATVILVAVAITVAVAVSYWMGGIAGQYTKFEKVEIQSGWAELGTTPVGWNITLELKNTGTATAMLIKVFVNDIPVDTYYVNQTSDILSTETGTSIPTDGVAIQSGDDQTIQVYIGESYKTLSSGTTVNVKIHSAGGMDYIKLIELV